MLGGRFQLVRRLGEGTFADVWEARNLRVDEDVPEMVAIKVLHGNQSRDNNRRERFSNGAAQMNALLHKHIVRVFGKISEYEGFFYFPMEYLPSGDLYSAVQADALKAPRLKWLRAILQVGSALSFAHDRGLIHRDVKPHNILLDEGGNAHLTDFDLALAREHSRMTRTKMALGTLAYAAPEQLDDAAHVDIRADIYGLGRTTLFLLFASDLPSESLHRREHFLKKLIPDSELRMVLSKATNWEPSLRYSSIMEYCDELRKFFPPESIDEIVSPNLINYKSSLSPDENEAIADEKYNLNRRTSALTRELLENAMQEYEEDRIKVARAMGLSYQGLIALLKRYGFDGHSNRSFE